MHPVTDTLHHAADDLKTVIPPLEHALGGLRAPEGHTRTTPGSKPPWNSHVAAVLTDIHAGVRELEQDLRYSIAGVIRVRGGSTRNTITAIDMILSLAVAAEHVVQRNTARSLDGWAWRGRVALGEAEPVQQFRGPASEIPRCQYCTFCTLRLRPLAGVVFCINPQCTDGDGRRPVARVEHGQVFGEALLVWQDGTVGLREVA